MATKNLRPSVKKYYEGNITRINNINKCYLCDSNIHIYHDVYIEDNKKIYKFRTCGLCKIIKNFTKTDMQNIIICNSDIPQYEIVKLTMESIIKKGKVPEPFEIDKNVKLVDIIPYRFIDMLNNLSNEDKKIFTKYKIFFTNRLDLNSVYMRNILLGQFKIENLDIKYFDIPKYIIQEKELEIYNRYLNEITEENNKKMCYNF